MVFLTITPAVLETLEELRSLERTASESELRGQKQTARRTSADNENGKEVEVKEGVNSGQRNHEVTVEGHISLLEKELALELNEPSLSNPKLGNPISHGQIIDLWKDSQARSSHPKTLESLLRGARVYNPPPKPKPEPTNEYKVLMARLRREEEERSYNRMTNPAPPMETFAQRFPLSSAAHAFASSQQPIHLSDPDYDDVTYADVNRQVTLIFNVLVSIVACAGAIWVVARWWSTPARLAISLGGSLLVGVAEVVVYSGYIRRVGESKKKEKGVKEVKEVINTWVVGAGERIDGGKADEKPISIEDKAEADNFKARRRKKGTK